MYSKTKEKKENFCYPYNFAQQKSNALKCYINIYSISDRIRQFFMLSVDVLYHSFIN